VIAPYGEESPGTHKKGLGKPRRQQCLGKATETILPCHKGWGKVKSRRVYPKFLGCYLL